MKKIYGKIWFQIALFSYKRAYKYIEIPTSKDEFLRHAEECYHQAIKEKENARHELMEALKSRETSLAYLEEANRERRKASLELDAAIELRKEISKLLKENIIM